VSSRFETLVVLDRAGGRPFVVNYQYYLSGQVNLRTRRSRVEAQVLRTEYKYPRNYEPCVTWIRMGYSVLIDDGACLQTV